MKEADNYTVPFLFTFVYASSNNILHKNLIFIFFYTCFSCYKEAHLNVQKFLLSCIICRNYPWEPTEIMKILPIAIENVQSDI